METTFNLERFVEAQNRYGDYARALSEMQAGQKTSHWIWYIFPQLRGLGRSYNSEYYGIGSLAEATAYLQHPVLGKRLREITAAVLRHTDEDARTLMGSGIDASKLHSSMTLFDRVAPGDIFGQVLDTFYGGQRDGRTLSKL